MATHVKDHSIHPTFHPGDDHLCQPLCPIDIGFAGTGLLVTGPDTPKHVTLATSPTQSAYDEFGKRYAQSLAAYGIEVKLLPSEGSAQNLEWLAAG
jgi:TRAP-type uncharacterized transport system substrate-binding protein